MGEAPNRSQASGDASPRARSDTATLEPALARHTRRVGRCRGETRVPHCDQGCLAATASISTSHSGVANAGTMIAVDAGRSPPSAFLRAAA